MLLTEWLAIRYDLWGRYAYSSTFTPVLPGGMPLPVVVAWGTIILLSYWVALSLFGFICQLGGIAIPATSSTLVRVIISLTASSVAVGFDLVMDPVMVKIGHWTWKTTGKWYGIPSKNFVGWFVTCSLAFIMVFSIIDPLHPLRSPYFASSVQWLFVGICLSLMIDLTLDAIKMRLIGPAIVGALTLAVVGAGVIFLMMF